MKNVILSSLIFVAGGLIASSAAQAQSAQVRSYSHTCQYEAPLSTYSRCDRNSWAGRAAFDCAVNEALLQCEEGHSSDCVVRGARYRSIISHQFIGYKACSVTVSVTGYRVR